MIALEKFPLFPVDPKTTDLRSYFHPSNFQKGLLDYWVLVFWGKVSWTTHAPNAHPRVPPPYRGTADRNCGWCLHCWYGRATFDCAAFCGVAWKPYGESWLDGYLDLISPGVINDQKLLNECKLVVEAQSIRWPTHGFDGIHQHCAMPGQVVKKSTTSPQSRVSPQGWSQPPSPHHTLASTPWLLTCWKMAFWSKGAATTPPL